MDRKARWRLNHPERERACRDRDNEARRFRRAQNRESGLDSSTPLTCTHDGCQKRGQVHHLPEDGFLCRCPEHRGADQVVSLEGRILGLRRS